MLRCVLYSRSLCCSLSCFCSGVIGRGQVCWVAAPGPDGNAQHHGERCRAGKLSSSSSSYYPSIWERQQNGSRISLPPSIRIRIQKRIRTQQDIIKLKKIKARWKIARFFYYFFIFCVTFHRIKKIRFFFSPGSISASSMQIKIQEIAHNADPDLHHCNKIS